MSNIFKIASTTIGSGGAASIVFSSIPATYTDLSIVFSPRSVRTGQPYDSMSIRINGDTGNNYTYKYMSFQGGNGTSNTGTGLGLPDRLFVVDTIPAQGSTVSTFGSTGIYIPNYANTSYIKSISVDSVGENNTAANGDWTITMVTGNWNNTAAINSITLAGYNSNLAEFTSATLYGIKNS